ncbi:hypothetical protein QR680_010874 [Steinernema hermaphroditum]|uniref:Uncharacterized protein n=1 Tax=Steinernema hermaphroditum TaxID=289476 RepID=A0AA39IRV9_9BILA|nr:hypothetical protein QR680_010874 [Steinernema hermaphroditum]
MCLFKKRKKLEANPEPSKSDASVPPSLVARVPLNPPPLRPTPVIQAVPLLPAPRSKTLEAPIVRAAPVARSTRSAAPVPKSIQTSKSKTKSNNSGSKTCVDSVMSGNTNKGKVAVVHNKMKSKPIENKPVPIETMRKQLEDTQKAMGVVPNTALLERMEKEEKCRQDRQQEPVDTSAMSKVGDISFSINKKKLVAANDDTRRPAVISEPEELIEEEKKNGEEEEPNSENYMYNTKEIHYTVHEMIRTLDKGDVPDVTGDVIVPDGQPPWDAFTDVEVMQKRDGFDCYTLRRNTFVSATTCFQNADDAMTTARTQRSSRDYREKALPTFNVKDINEHTIDRCGEEESLGTLITPQSSAYSAKSLKKTQSVEPSMCATKSDTLERERLKKLRKTSSKSKSRSGEK